VAVASSLLACTEDSGLEYQHGSVKLEFRRGDGVGVNPFEGTSIMEVTLNYEACLIDFYTANSNWSPNGVDGETVFGGADLEGEGWKDRLCELGSIDCEVVSLTQQLDPNLGSWLKVSYQISSEIENHEIHFGPLPLPDLAVCEAGAAPTVRVSNMSAVRGLDGLPPDGEVIWAIQKFNPDNAFADQGASINIDGELN